MSFFKLRFIQNKCRICKKMHCCVECRIEHEKIEHDIFPDCDICIYGKIFLREPSEELLTHIRCTHWPLHCTYCKRLFGSIAELKEHIKCPVGAPQGSMEIAPAYTPPVTTKTPIRPTINFEAEQGDDFFSPPMAPLNKQFFHFSTPTVVRTDSILDTFPDTITPVDNNDRSTKIKNANACLSQTPITTEDKTDSDMVYSKRRVTFSDTPNMETSRKASDGSSNFVKTSLKNCEPHKLNLKDMNITEDFEKTGEKSDANYKTTECIIKLENITEIQENDENEHKTKKKRISSTFNETLWQSAINEFDLTDDNLNDSRAKSKSIYCENNDSYEVKPNIKESLHYTDQACGSFECSAFSDISNIHKKSLWSSMAQYVKSAVQVFQSTAIKSEEEDYCNKRSFSEIEYNSDTELHKLKRRKITEIKCRPSIRDLTHFKLLKKVLQKVDKSTQTD